MKHLTEEQYDAITSLCSLRHDLDTGMDQVTVNDCFGIKRRLCELAFKMHKLGLKPIKGIPYGDGGCIDIDSIEELWDWEEWPESNTQEWQDKYDEEYGRIYGELSRLNENIEDWLADIDEKYGTKFKPTRALIFR